MLAAFGRSAEEPQASSTLGARLCDWVERVVSWNQRIDLTAARTVDELVDLFVADAALLATTLEPGCRPSLVDVGSGAGAPGVGIALLAPEIGMTLVDPKAKRVAFLRTVLGSLDRGDVRVERKRVDELPDLAWDIAVSRATLEPSEWLAEGARIARQRVWVLLAHGDSPVRPGLRAVHERHYVWPLTGLARRAVAYEPLR